MISINIYEKSSLFFTTHATLPSQILLVVYWKNLCTRKTVNLFRMEFVACIYSFNFQINSILHNVLEYFFFTNMNIFSHSGKNNSPHDFHFNMKKRRGKTMENLAFSQTMCNVDHVKMWRKMMQNLHFCQIYILELRVNFSFQIIIRWKNVKNIYISLSYYEINSNL